MLLDIAAVLILICLALIGFRLGLRVSLVASLGLGALVALGVMANDRADLPLPGVALAILVWIACLLGTWIALYRRGRGRSVTGAGLGIVQGAVIIVLLIGALGSAMPTSLVAGAWVYPPIAAAGSRIAGALPQTTLTFPAPDDPKGGKGQPTRSARPIDWAEAVAFEARPVRYLTGSLRAADRAPLGFEVDGRVASVAVDIGDSFREGDILATLDSPTLQIALNQAESALIEAQAIARDASLAAARQATLHDRGVVSDAARDTARAQLQSAESRLAVAEARVDEARERLADTQLVAPYDGEIAARAIEPAQLYRPGSPAFEVQSSSSGFEIDVTVPETIIGRVSVGSAHRAVLLDGSKTKFPVSLTEIGSRAERASGFPVTFTVLDPVATLRAGMAVEVAMRLRPTRPDLETAIAIPLSAIRIGDGGARMVFVFNPSTETLSRRDVRLAGTESGQALIVDGIVPGDIVATAGLPFLKHGMDVSLMGRGIARFDQ